MAKTQTLSFPIRLPDAIQAEALRLLDASRLAINEIIFEVKSAISASSSCVRNRAVRCFRTIWPKYLAKSRDSTLPLCQP